MMLGAASTFAVLSLQWALGSARKLLERLDVIFSCLVTKPLQVVSANRKVSSRPWVPSVCH